jgi:hypothetical protein
MLCRSRKKRRGKKEEENVYTSDTKMLSHENIGYFFENNYYFNNENGELLN